MSDFERNALKAKKQSDFLFVFGILLFVIGILSLFYLAFELVGIYNIYNYEK